MAKQLSVDEYSFIKDQYDRKLYYILRLAKNPKKARTVFVLHEHACNAEVSGFIDENWNIVCPIDNYGLYESGSWWLGEKGDFFVKDLMLNLVDKIKKLTGSNRLYFWGSSMGAYGAIMFGLLCRAEAVFAHMPQIRLKNTVYTDGKMKKFFDEILDDNFPHWIDLTSLLVNTKKKNCPLFFLIQPNSCEYRSYIEEHVLSFIEKCQKLGFRYYLKIYPGKINATFKEDEDRVQLFEQYNQEINDWLIDRRINL